MNDLFTPTDTGGYILGVFWATGTTFTDKGHRGWWIRHRERWYVTAVRRYLGLGRSGHISHSSTGKQYRLKISREGLAERITESLTSLGWTGRQAEERVYPEGDICDRAFCRAWIEIHSTMDIIHPKRCGPTPRLRVYGNYILMETMNLIIARETGLIVRKPIKTSNDITVGLYFIGSSCHRLLDWIYDDAEIWNKNKRKVWEEILENNTKGPSKKT